MQVGNLLLGKMQPRVPLPLLLVPLLLLALMLASLSLLELLMELLPMNSYSHTEDETPSSAESFTGSRSSTAFGTAAAPYDL